MTSRLRGIALGIGLFAGLANGVGIAQEAPVAEGPLPEAGAPASESTYLDLRRSKDRTIRQWAERYSSLTKLQEWTSAAGKKVKAKYVSHSPDLSTVTLAVSGKNVDVPVAKLDKRSQSLVKQIAVTQKKLDELIAAGADGEPGEAGETPAADPGAPMVDEIGAQPRRPPTARRPTRPIQEEPPAAAPVAAERPAPVDASSADDGDPDPLGFGELELPVQTAADGGTAPEQPPVGE
jgi:hypothetical protein